MKVPLRLLVSDIDGTLVRNDKTLSAANRASILALAADDAATMLRLIGRYGVTPWVFADGEWFTPDPSNRHVARELLASCLESARRDNFVELGARIDKIVGVSDHSETLRRLETEAKQAIGPDLTIAHSQPYYLDITHCLANKGDGIATLTEAAGLELPQVAAFGDIAQ